MSFEGPPSTPEKKDEGVTEETAFEAMKRGDLETVRSWYIQEEVRADSDPGRGGRTLLAFKLGRMQLQAGFREEGMDSLRAAREDAYNQHQEALLKTIDEALSHAEQP